MAAIAYYRVSILKKGTEEDSLGLNAQRGAVKRYAAANGLTIVQEFQEVETGTNKRRRVAIYEAIEAAKKNNAVLLIAKLDRLARNVHFISGLMESGVKFVAVDMPSVTNLTLHILAAVAEEEAKMISKRTKAALAVVKAQGRKLGKPENMSHQAQTAGAAANREAARQAYQKTVGYIKRLKQDSLSLAAIADILNSEGHRTRQGKQFYPATVQRILDRAS